MCDFKPNEKLVYIAKRGISLTFYCVCGDAIGKGNCPRCNRANTAKKENRKAKAEYLNGFNPNEYWRKII